MKKNTKKSNEKDRSTPGFRAMDAVIILLVITAVIGVYFRYNILDLITKKQNLSDYTISFSIEDIRYTTPNYINIGDKFYYADDKEELGVLISESANMSNMALGVQPASKYFMGSDGVVEEIYYPNLESRVDAKGRIQCRGRYTDDGGFLVNGSRYLSAGQSISVQTELVSVVILIQNIEAVQQ